MTLPVFFRDSREQVVASFSFTDIIQGNGIGTYYLFEAATDSGTTYGAAQDLKRSKDEEYTATVGAGSSTASVDYDAGEFIKNMTIEGTAYAQGSFGATLTSGSGTLGDVSIRVVINKWDGASETQIATETSQAISSGTKTDFLIPITVPKTTFKAGDTLRLTMEIVKVGGTGGVWAVYYGNDPLNRDGTYLTPSSDNTTTQTKITIPFKIDL